MNPILDLRREGAATRVELPERLEVSDAQREHAISTWQGRMVNEHASARVFGQLVQQMMVVGLPAEEVRLAGEMLAQELHHGRLCAGVVFALGGDPRAEMPALPEVPRHEDVQPFEALLRNILSISCLHETVAVALLQSGRHRGCAGPIGEAVRTILSDEIGHARLGWRTLARYGHDLPAQMRERLGEYLIAAFRQLYERHYASEPAQAMPGIPVLGVDGPADSTAILVDTVASVIVPGLEAFGLPASDALMEAVKAS